MFNGFFRFKNKLYKAMQLSLQDWSDFLKACIDLAIARVMLLTVQPNRIVSHNVLPIIEKSINYSQQDRVIMVNRVGKAILLAAHNVPWRSDCLIQAIAARRRLQAVGLDSELRLGVCKTSEGSFAAHAWLLQGEMMVTGGEVSEYSRLI